MTPLGFPLCSLPAVSSVSGNTPARRPHLAELTVCVCVCGLSTGGGHVRPRSGQPQSPLGAAAARCRQRPPAGCSRQSHEGQESEPAAPQSRARSACNLPAGRPLPRSAPPPCCHVTQTHRQTGMSAPAVRPSQTRRRHIQQLTLGAAAHTGGDTGHRGAVMGW